MATKQEVKAAIEILKAVAETIHDLGRVPSGHLYAQLMNFISLDQYNQIINMLKKAKLIEEKFHELIWIGN